MKPPRIIDGFTLEEFLSFLTNTLIPDLDDSGSEGMAGTLRTAVGFLTPEPKPLFTGLQFRILSLLFLTAENEHHVSRLDIRDVALRCGETMGVIKGSVGSLVTKKLVTVDAPTNTISLTQIGFEAWKNDPRRLLS